MQAARTNAIKAIHRFGPPTLIMLGSLWLLQSAFAHTVSHGVLIRNLSYDAGIVKRGSTLTDTVQLFNLSSVPVEVGAQPGCGCTAIEVPEKPLSPLHSGVVKAQVDTSGMKMGRQAIAFSLNVQSGKSAWQQTIVIKFRLR